MNTRHYFSRTSRRILFVTVWLLALALIAVSVGGMVLAQDGSPRKIAFGDSVSGTLNEQAFSQTYTFDGTAGQSVSISTQSTTQGLTLALLLTDSGGQTVAQASSAASQEVTLTSIVLPSTGAYFITVLRYTGAQGTVAGNFTLTLQGSAAAAPTAAPTAGPITLNSGMSVSLNWQSTDDLDIEVRDPVGNAIFAANPRSGNASLVRDVNDACQNTTPNATETVSWTSGAVPSGSYEILVYYNEACRQPSQPVDFSLVVSVNGQAQPSVTGRLNANEQYVASFFLDSATDVTVNAGGANPLLLNLAPFGAQINSPTPLGGRTTIEGRIDRNTQAEVWSFDGAVGQSVTVAMDALNGSLDPQLILLGPDRAVLGSNDDANDTTRNALIASQPLTVTGQYLIVATRFGKNIGGTEGGYRLTITLSGGGQAFNATPAPTLAGGAAPTSVAVGATPATTSLAGALGIPLSTINVTMTWNSNADLRLLVRDPSGQSVFSDVRSTNNGGTLFRQDNLNCLNTTTAPITAILWQGERVPAGTYEIQVWLRESCGELILPNFTLAASVRGAEVLNITRTPDPNSAVLFVTTFTVAQDGTTTVGEQGFFLKQAASDLGNLADQIAVATPINYGRPLAGNVSATAPYTIYSLQGRAGDRIQVSMRTTLGTLDPFLFLLSPDNVQLAQNDDAGPSDRNSSLTFTLPSDGQYLIIATRFGARYGGTTGNFEIAVAATR